MPFDARWLVVAHRARNASGSDITPGHVAAVWLALLDHASQARPRGNVAGFDAASVAAFFQWPEEHVQAIVSALTAAGRIVDGCIVAFATRQHGDPTGAKRQAKRRERIKREAGEGAESPPINVTSRDNHENERDSHVYKTGQRESLQSCSSTQDTHVVTPLNVAPATIAGLWEYLESQGIPAGMIARLKNKQTLQDWHQAGASLEQVREAIKRARKQRDRQGDPAPLNVPYVSRFLEGVMSGKPAPAEGGFAATDASVDEYLARSAR